MDVLIFLVISLVCNVGQFWVAVAQTRKRGDLQATVAALQADSGASKRENLRLKTELAVWKQNLAELRERLQSYKDTPNR